MARKRYPDYPTEALEDVVRLRREIVRAGVPPKITDRNLLIASWNIRAFGGISDRFLGAERGRPKRNLRALAAIAEIVRCFDIVAVQEVRRETTAIRRLIADFLGSDWDLLLSDVSAGSRGNSERLAFLWDRRRVSLSGLAGEIVLPPRQDEDSGAMVPEEQFDRTPYMVGFKAGDHRITLLTAHIRYGGTPEERLPELRNLAAYTARQIRDKASQAEAEEANLIVLGDFNIDERSTRNPLWNAFTSEGLGVRPEFWDLKTTTGRANKHYDQIAWFQGALSLEYSRRAGVIDFADAVFKELTPGARTWRISDHLPLWVEFKIDTSESEIATALGLDPTDLDPLTQVV